MFGSLGAGALTALPVLFFPSSSFPTKIIEVVNKQEKEENEIERAEVAKQIEEIKQMNLPIQKQNDQLFFEAKKAENARIDEMNESRGYWDIQTYKKTPFHNVIDYIPMH